MTNLSRRIAAAALPAVLLAVLTACGGGGGRPSVADIENALKKDSSFGQLSEDKAKCVAQAFHDSDISDKALNQAVSNDDSDLSKSDEEALKAVLPDVAKCVGVDPSKLSDALD